MQPQNPKNSEQREHGPFERLEFSRWLFVGRNSKPGILNLFSWPVLGYVAISWYLANSKSIDFKDGARSVILPLLSIVIGLAFAWSGNVFALAQTPELSKLFDRAKGGIANHIGYYQLVITLVLMTTAFWGLVALGVIIPQGQALKFALFFFLSMSLYECWSVIDSVRYLLIYKHELTSVSRVVPEPAIEFEHLEKELGQIKETEELSQKDT